MDILENEILKVTLSPYAASIHEILDKRTGKRVNLVLDSEEEHLTDPSYGGNTVGAYAGRLKDAYLVIDGVRYELDKNEGRNSIHGGYSSLRRKWSGIRVSDYEVIYETEQKHLEDGLPGNRKYMVTYTLAGNSLEVHMEAMSSIPTYFNLTNHTYISISDSRDMRDVELSIPSSKVVINDEENIPVKEIPLKDTAFDFNRMKRVGKLDETEELSFSRGLNNSYCLEGPVTVRSGETEVVIETDAPTAVFYMGGYLETPFSGLAIEPENEVLFTHEVDGMLMQTREIKYTIR